MHSHAASKHFHQFRRLARRAGSEGNGKSAPARSPDKESVQGRIEQLAARRSHTYVNQVIKVGIRSFNDTVNASSARPFMNKRDKAGIGPQPETPFQIVSIAPRTHAGLAPRLLPEIRE